MRILTTHIGSLPRPTELVTILRQHDAGGAAAAAVEARARAAVDDVVRAQVAAGIDIVNDGEQGRTDYSTYIKDRLTGFEGEHADQVIGADLKEFPEFAARRRGSVFKRPTCSDRKSTRLNSSHMSISYAVFCLKKKKKKYLEHYSIKKKNSNHHVIY